MKQPLVAIECIVYNHEKFLRECLDSLVGQQTNFPFVVVAHDDKSTDSSAEIIREYATKYPEIVVPAIETENQWSKKDGSLQRKVYEAVQAFKPKYVAICEGDDFWTDMHKLQKQVDILEADESLMGVAAEAIVVDEESGELQPCCTKIEKSRRFTLREFFKENPQYPTASVVWRNSHPEEVERMFEYTITQYVDDWNLWIAIHTFGDFYFVKENMVAYRIQANSITHTNGRVDRAKANKEICPKIADILPEEYADIATDLRDTRWVWEALMYAYKAEKRYLRMIGCIIMGCFVCPRALWSSYKSRKASRK